MQGLFGLDYTLCSLFATGFPIVVSQYSNLAALTSDPSQIRTCAVTTRLSAEQFDGLEFCNHARSVSHN